MTGRVKAILVLGTILLAVLLAVPGREETASSVTQVPASAVSVAEQSERVLAPGAARIVSAADSEAQQARKRELGWIRNPFQGPATEVVQASELPLLEPVLEPPPPPPAVIPRLTGVSQRGGASWAIIDGEIVRAGDRLPSGHDVVHIAHRSVTLQWNDQELRLNLGEER